VDAYQRALALDPAFRDGYVALGRLYVLLNRDAEAVDAMRRALVTELEPLTTRDEAGELVRMGGAPSRFSAAGKDSSFVPLRPDLVVEVAFDQLEGHRFRHAVSLVRWRPDREPRSCRIDQIDRASAYDLGQVLVTG